MAKKKHEEEHENHERWLVSYADFMTLLFAFFATMYSLSTVDALNMAKVAHALQLAFDNSVKAQAAPPPATRRLATDDELEVERSSAVIREQIAGDLAQELSADRLKVIVDRRGVTLSIPEAGTFGVGRDELSSTAEQLVGRVATTLGRFGNAVRVEGHTDDVPIHTVRFQSNWDLSAARASRVVEFLIARGLAPDRLSATGYGEFHPHVPNDSAEARASNRRIDLVILNAATTSAEEPASAGPHP
jgi:chemotaxis protein MotB